MRDTMYPLRKAVIDVLNSDKPTFNGITVTTYDEKKKASASDNLYIITSTQQSVKGENQNDSTWVTRDSIDLEIVHKTEFEVTKDIIDSISDQLYQKLIPQRLSQAIADPHLMQIQFFDVERAISRTIETSSTQTIISKVITFSCDIIQQS